MRKLNEVAAGHIELDVAEADRLGERIDIGLRTGQEVPSVGGFGTAIAFHVLALLCCGQIGALGGIDADHDDVEVLAGKVANHFQSAGQAVEFLGAQHGAAIVNQRKNRRAPAEVGTQRDLLACVVSKRQVERQLRVEMLVDAHAAENRRRFAARSGLPSESTIAAAVATAVSRQCFRIVLLNCMLPAPFPVCRIRNRRLNSYFCSPRCTLAASSCASSCSKLVRANPLVSGTVTVGTLSPDIGA